jgi:serine/threonine protein kinase
VKKPTPFGKYYLLERINIGGMAEVFRAKAFGVEGFERLVAVKRILPNIAEDKEFIRMFIEEAKLSVQLNHANIAQIFDLGVFDGSYYIALEHVHGRDLRAMFERCRQLGETMPVAQACFVAMKVCEGLDYAHNKRDQAGRELSLVHRDVSPQNILVSFEGEVKLIDFGIAKAAGTTPGSQAGVLKGKFGYMSPEQVRGQELDRRSDVFSCGIVLYELLTGERLFVGESDFGTLEKVRNVEILPPSTYNRKIPDELERIVLKALSKDAEDRYQNAIDLHDELQAFVYTAGEFYSRKDLAVWMKRTFGKEIEEETAKLESYRQLKPPPPAPAGDAAPEPVRAPPSQGSQTSQASHSGRVRSPSSKPITQPVAVARPARSTQSVATAKPPPPPVSRSQPVPVIQPQVQLAEAAPIVLPPKQTRAHKPTRPIDLSWDDDDLETRVYDGDDPRHKSNRSGLPLQPPASSPGIPLVEAAPEYPQAQAHAQAHAQAQASMMPGPTSGSGAYHNGAAPHPGFPGGMGRPVHANGVSGSHDLPMSPLSDPGPSLDAGAMPARRELSALQRIAVPAPTSADLPTLPVTSFGARIASRRTGGRSSGVLAVAIGGVALVVAAAVVVIALAGRTRPSPEPAPPPVVAAPPPVTADPNTGFDLYVTPAGITQWKLDGESRTDRLPSRIRGISPGPHTVQIEPPPGFLSFSQQVAVELGKAPKVEIALQPISGLSGVFESTPPGATVSLIIDGKRQPVGPSPARAPLDPRNTYQVLFEKPGYVSVNRPVAFSGALEERVVVNLEKVAAPQPPPAPEPRPHRPSRPASEKPVEPAPVIEPAAAPDKPAADRPAEPRAKGQGVLVLGSKPPCDIAIDGSPTGLTTPQKEIKLSAGKHRVTLTNSEFNISETFSVDIKPDQPEKLIKDYSDRLPN